MTTRRARERRLAIGLSATLLALVGAMAALDRADRRAGSADTASAPFVPDAVRRIAIERPGHLAIALERTFAATAPDTAARGADGNGGDGGDWRIVAPCAIDANDARVAPLLDALASRAIGYSAAEVDLAAAGLVDPLAVVRIDGVPIRLGGTDLGGERRYAQRAERVALVPEWVLSLVEGGLSALAEPVAFPLAPTRLRRLDGEAGSDEDVPSIASASAPESERAPVLGAAIAELDPRPWSGLAASQVVTWPVANAPPEGRRTRLEATLPSGETRTHELVGNVGWNALLTEDGGCARLFADIDLPDGTWR